MSYVRSFLTFWYDLIIGDDWTVAPAVALGLVVIWFLSHNHINFWWLLPVVVLLIGAISTQRTAQKSS